MSRGERIKQLRIKAKMTQQELAEKLNVTKQTIHKYESEIITNIPSDKLEIMSELFHVSPTYIMGWEISEDIAQSNAEYLTNSDIRPVPKTKTIPLLGTIACGKPIFAEEHKGEYINVPEEYDADFALICRGDIMEPLIFDGDTVLIRSQLTVTDGDIGAVLIDDEVTLKHIYYNADTQTLRLTPENKKYSPLIYSGRNVTYAQILGRVMIHTGNSDALPTYRATCQIFHTRAELGRQAPVLLPVFFPTRQGAIGTAPSHADNLYGIFR